ncbi:MAG: shikimate kinase [Alloprevotella sp.]|nr:shikimate kinase [Alloprevotella sp.]
MKSIAIIGYMCAGKTFVGRELARLRNQMFYDLDWYIEHRYRKKIADIFSEEGEEGFRLKERRMLHEVASFEDIVLSCGGGTPCYYDNMDFLNETSITFYLKASPETLFEHFKMSRQTRPMVADAKDEELDTLIRTQLTEREPFYKKAQHIIDINTLGSAELITEVAQIIQKTATQTL